MPSPLSHRARSSLLQCPPSSPPLASSSTSVFSCPFPDPKTQDVFNSIVRGRKSWKTQQGGEIVWPPELEAALVEGMVPSSLWLAGFLTSLQDLNSTFPTILEKQSFWEDSLCGIGISQTIFFKRRVNVAPQSKLAVDSSSYGILAGEGNVSQPLSLLWTCHLSWIVLKQLVPHRPRKQSSGLALFNFSGATSDSESNSDASPPATPTEAHATLQNLLYRGVGGLGRDEELSNIICIDLLPKDAPIGSDGKQVLQMPPSSETNVIRASQCPRHIRDIDPTVTLVASSSMIAKSHFIVRTRTGIVHTEVTDMTLVGPLPVFAKDQLLYSTKLVPAFWNELCKSPGAPFFVQLGWATPLM